MAKSVAVDGETVVEVRAPQQVHELSTGYHFTTRAVNSMLLYDVQEKYTFPSPPLIQYKQGGNLLYTENTGDPNYLDRYDDVQRKRNMAALELLIRRGVVLADPLPEDETWLEDLEMDLDLDKYRGPDGSIKDRWKPYIFLRYVAIQGQDDFRLISETVSVTEAGAKAAEEMFPGNEA